MILHQQLPHPTNGQRLPWFSVHCEALAIALCTPNPEGKITISIRPGDDSPIAVTSSDPLISRGDSWLLISHSLPEGLTATSRSIPQSPISNLESPIPPYLLLNSLDGTTPAIMHTSDPVFIAFADPATAVIRAPEHYRSTVDLTPEGWAYWWEDAQRAFEKLTLESAAAFGIQVPEKIRDQG